MTEEKRIRSYNFPTIQALFGKEESNAIFVVGTGPSLLDFDWSRLEGKRTIALNDAIFRFRPTYHLFSDSNLANRYFKHDYSNVTIICQYNAAKRFFQHPEFNPHREQVYIFWMRGPDISPTSHELWCDHTVSATGVQLAWKLGATTIYLLGCDGYKVGDAHYCTDDPGQHRDVIPVLKRSCDSWDHDQVSEQFFNNFGWPKDGIWNLSEHSTIRTWPKKSMDDVL